MQSAAEPRLKRSMHCTTILYRTVLHRTKLTQGLQALALKQRGSDYLALLPILIPCGLRSFTYCANLVYTG